MKGTLSAYQLLVNQAPGIRERYQKKRNSVSGIRRIEAWTYLVYSFAICVIRASVIRGASLGEKEREICPTVFFNRGFNRVWRCV